MLILVRLNNALLIRTLLLSSVALVRILPRINLARDFIIEVRADDLHATGGTVALPSLILVVPRQRTCILTVLPPHHRLIRRSKALNGAKRTIVRELTINRWLARLTIKRTRPLGLRLRQPTNVVRLLLQHKAAVGNTRPSRTRREVPRLLHTVGTRGVAARVHVTCSYYRVLLWVGVLTPHADAGLAALHAS